MSFYLFKKSARFCQGCIISPNRIQMDPKKTIFIEFWPVPSSAHDIEVFLGFTNFHRKFISTYAPITNQMTVLLKKDATFNWSSTVKKSLLDLKEAFANPPIRIHPNNSIHFIIETDASDDVIGAILSV